MEGFVANTKVNFDAEAQRANGMRKVTKWFLGIAAVAGATGGSVLAEKPTKHVDFHHLGGDEDIDDVPFESAAVIKPVAEIRNHGVDFLENGVGDEISFNPVDNFRNGYVETVDVGDEISFNPVDNFRNGYVETVDVGDEISFNPVDNFRNGYEETVDVGDEISFNPVDNFRNGYVETVDVGDEISFNPVDNFRNGYEETVDVGDEISFNPVDNFRNGYVETVDVGDEISFNPVDNFRNGYEETVDVGDEISFNPVDNFRNGYEETVDVGDEISFNPVDNFRNGYEETVDVGDEISFNPVDNFRNGYEETVDVGDEISFNPVDNFRNGYVETVEKKPETKLNFHFGNHDELIDPGMRTGEFHTLSNFGGDYELIDAEKRNEGMFNPVDNFRNGYEETVEKKPETKLNFHFGNHDELIDPGMRTGEFHTLSNFGGDYELINAEKRNEGMFNPVDNFRNGYEETVDNSIQVGKERYKKILDGIHEYFVENKSLNQYVYLLKTVINRADINLPEPIYRLLGYMKPGDLDTACSVYISHRIARLMVDVFVPQKPITFRGRMARLDLFHMFLALIMEAMNSNTN